MSDEQPKIEITKSRFGWRVQVGERYSSQLDFGEMLSTICHLTIGGEIKPITFPYGGLRTTEEHKANYRAMGMNEEQITEMEQAGSF